MRFTRLKALSAAVVLAGSLAACGDAGSGGGSDSAGGDAPEYEVVENAADNFDAGTRMKELAEAGTIKVGVKYDQPGLGFMGTGQDIPEGFDVEIAKILVASLGIDPEDTSKVQYIETVSDNREPFLQSNKVDLVLASYSITDERRQVVGQAGPYMITGQQLLVPEDSDVESIDDLKGEEVCSVKGSTSLENVTANGMKGVGFENYQQCVDQVLNGSVPAMSTDGSILLGYAAANEGQLKVVGDEFSEERIGVGYSKQHPEMCQWINDTLTAAADNGDYAEAWDATLGASGEEAPELPELDACQ